MTARLLPHSPESIRPARRCAAASRPPARVTRPRPSLSCAMPRVAVFSPSRKRFCSGLGGSGGVSGGGVDSARVESEIGVCALSESAAAVMAPRDAARWLYVYPAPRMDAPRADPYDGTLLYDEPGVRAYIFAQRVHAIALFRRASLGLGAVIAMLGRRAPELRHVRRWLQAVFAEPAGETGSTRMLTGWFATGGAGVLFLPHHTDEPYAYCEVGAEGG